MWLHQLLIKLDFNTTIPIKLWCDNEVTLHSTSNPVVHEHAKHIKIGCHFAQEKIQQGSVSIEYVKIGEHLGDIFTKALNGV